MNERMKLDGLTAARFYAAMMIVFFHLSLMPKLEMPSWLVFIKSHFGIGVPLFYVISAFSLYVGYKSGMENRTQIHNYFVRRFFRIAPLFYLMMIVYLIYLYLEYGATVALGHIITSATFTFNMAPQYVTGYVWASWSIGVEMMFYFILPMLILGVSSLPRAIAFFILCAYIVVLWAQAFSGVTGPLVNLGNYFLAAHMAYFAGGILAYFAWLRIRHRPDIGLAALVLGVVSFVVLINFRGDIAQVTGAGLLKPIQTIPLMLFVIGVAICPVSILVNRFTRTFGETSFSLYLFHPLIIGFLMNRGFYKWVYEAVPNVTLAYAASALVTLAILFPLALLGYRYIEVPGNRLGAKLLERRRSQVRGGPLPYGKTNREPAQA